MSGSFVIDNSVVMSWCFKDEIGQYADAVLDCLQESTAFVPSTRENGSKKSITPQITP